MRLAGAAKGEWIRSTGPGSDDPWEWGRLNSDSLPYPGLRSFGFAFLFFFDISVVLDHSERGEWSRSIGLHSDAYRTWDRLNSYPIPNKGTFSFGFANP